MRQHVVLLGIGALGLSAFGMMPRGGIGPDPTRVPAETTVETAAAAPVTAVKSAPVASAAEAEALARKAAIATAVGALSPKVTESSDPAALSMAIRAYYNYRAAHPERVKKPYLYFVDYGLDSRTPRGYVFDMDDLTVVDGPFTVAHGRGSGPKNGVPTRFSNGSGSASTSLGLFVTQERYSFTGKTGGRRYGSVGMRLDGVSGFFNDGARARGVVVHGAPYVTPAGSGRSEGCPAMQPTRAERLIPKLAEGSLVFLFSPRDKTWEEQDPWAHGVATTGAHGD